MSDTLTRTVDGATVPAAGKYDIDPAHTTARFQIRHLGLSKVRGGFDAVAGSIVIDEDPARSSVDVQIDAASFTTGNEDRDNHVRSPDFLNVEEHPQVAYRSSRVVRDGEGWKVEGDLTIAGVSKPVTLDVAFDGAGGDPWGGSRIGFEATAEIDRDDFGVSWNQTLETGGFLLGKTVKISIDVQAVSVG